MYDIEGTTDCFDARAELDVVSRAGHFAQAERPDGVADNILAFANDCSSVFKPARNSRFSCDPAVGHNHTPVGVTGLLSVG